MNHPQVKNFIRVRKDSKSIQFASRLLDERSFNLIQENNWAPFRAFHSRTRSFKFKIGLELFALLFYLSSLLTASNNSEDLLFIVRHFPIENTKFQPSEFYLSNFKLNGFNLLSRKSWAFFNWFRIDQCSRVSWQRVKQRCHRIDLNSSISFSFSIWKSVSSKKLVSLRDMTSSGRNNPIHLIWKGK